MKDLFLTVKNDDVTSGKRVVDPHVSLRAAQGEWVNSGVISFSVQQDSVIAKMSSQLLD